MAPRRKHVCKNCRGKGWIPIPFPPSTKNMFMKCDKCEGRGKFYKKEINMQ